MRSLSSAALALAFALGAATAVGHRAEANQRSDALRREAYDAAYNLDTERAVDLFRQAVAADPDDPAALRGAAGVIWMRILYLRGTMLVEDYMGRLRGSGDVKMPAPPADLDQAFHQHLDKAIALGEKAVDQRYKDPSAHYDLAAALGLAASYAGTVQGKVYGAMKLGRRSFSESEMVLELDKRRKEAGLVAGTYRYLVSTLPVYLRWMAYVVGFGGGKEQGLRLIEEAAAHPSDAQADARFALVLMYNREARYLDAVKVLRGLEQSYPRNRLLQLEAASTLLRADRAGEALAVLDAAMGRLPQDTRERMPGEDARWHLKRGIARLRSGILEGAEEDLRAAASGTNVRNWVRVRIHIELGKVADLRGDRDKAKTEYQTAVALAEAIGEEQAAAESRRLLGRPYKQ